MHTVVGIEPVTFGTTDQLFTTDLLHLRLNHLTLCDNRRISWYKGWDRDEKF